MSLDGSFWASLVAQRVKNLLAMQETRVRSLGWKDLLEKGKATHSIILSWRIPWNSPSGHKESDRTEWLSLSLSQVWLWRPAASHNKMPRDWTSHTQIYQTNYSAICRKNSENTLRKSRFIYFAIMSDDHVSPQEEIEDKIWERSNCFLLEDWPLLKMTVYIFIS